MTVNVLVVAALFAANAAFHLNPSAPSEGDGSAARPFKTFAAAQKAVRAAVKDKSGTGDVVVEIAAGRHYIPETVKFMRADSGTPERRVIWRAAGKGQARLTGGRDLPPLVKPDAATLAKLPPEARDHVLETDLRSAGIDAALPHASLVWGESFLLPSRWPNDGFTTIAAVEKPGKDANGNPIKPRGFTYADDRVGTWADETDGRAIGYFMYDWFAVNVNIAKIDPVKRTLEQEGECTHYGYSTRGYWYGENLLREIDLPGEYHVSAKTGKLTVWAPEGKTAHAPQFTVTDTLFYLHELQNVAFDGLVFENTREQAVRGEYSRCLGFTACTFVNVGKAATFTWCRRVRVAGCDAAHCNFGAFYFDRSGDPDKLERADNVIENCHVSDYARLKRTYAPAVGFSGCGVTVRRCLFDHGPHVAVLFNGREHSISCNEIHSVCLESGEMGAVYCGRDWTLCGNEISGNYFHDIGLGGKGWNPNRAIMLDDGAAGLVMMSNRFIRVAEGISLSSIGNRIEKNLFVDNWPAISGWATWDEPVTYTNNRYTHASLRDKFLALPAHEEPWKSRYPYLSLMRTALDTQAVRDPATRSTVLDNVIVRGPEETFFWVWKSYATKRGWWNVGGNVRSADGHEAEKFLPPLSAIGLYDAPERAVWPVKTEVKRNDSRALMEFQKKHYRPSPDASRGLVERDIVVYGSTPAALAAAVQAKRMGASCIVVSPETRIGGLTTGGLGQTDIGNKSAFGGIALEFYRAVAAWYRDDAHWPYEKRNAYLPDGQCAGTKGTDSMWTFEPSAALAILEGWERRDGLEIVRGSRLDRSAGKVKVESAGNGAPRRIVSFVTEDGAVYRGKMFVDATYEGDLMAAAGVSYHVGREANSVYGETISGIQRARAVSHQFHPGVSAYVVKGDPKSGLLPGVQEDVADPDGTGDSRVQAYCFRMCLTDVPENRIPFKKPANYRELDYELLFREFEQVALHPEMKDHGYLGSDGVPNIMSMMPNRKTDTNNRTGFSTDFIGANWAWPEASYAEREKILKAHLDYQQGLMWTLANHPRIPEKTRRYYSRWGTCRDEFLDGLGDGWQRQLYVREARRMVSDYVVCQLDCLGKRQAARPVAMAAYGMDSHHSRRYVDKTGCVRNEGDIQDWSAGGKPYPIDYGAVVPKKAECANLLVPVCVSASHMAFGSIRMEPVFFALGQVAGTAATQAIAAGRAVQDIDYRALAARLVRDGQVLAVNRK